MKLGMVGLGRMGKGMTDRLRQFDQEVVGWDANPEHADVGSLKELVEALEAPRAVWVMLPAGDPTESTVQELKGLLAEGDIIINGANDRYTEDQRRAEELDELGIGYIDAGVSGGIWGLREGFAIMVGGTADNVARLQPVFDALAPVGGFAHAGPVGAGHFTKMVHNGIEYGMMQSFAEGVELLEASELGIDVNASLKSWQHGSVVRSWLLDLLVLAEEQDPGLTQLKGYADDTGEGRWTIEEAIRLAVPVPAISSALFARFSSRQVDSPAMKVIAAMRNQFGGHAVHAVDGDEKTGSEKPEHGQTSGPSR